MPCLSTINGHGVTGALNGKTIKFYTKHRPLKRLLAFHARQAIQKWVAVAFWGRGCRDRGMPWYKMMLNSAWHSRPCMVNNNAVVTVHRRARNKGWGVEGLAFREFGSPGYPRVAGASQLQAWLQTQACK